MVKNPPVNAGDARDAGSIPGSGRSSGVGNSNPPQYSCLENSTDSGAWRAAVHGVPKNHTCLSTSCRKGKTMDMTYVIKHMNEVAKCEQPDLLLVMIKI